MTVIRHQDAPRFTLGDAHVVGFAAPSRGGRETCLWRLTIAPGSEGVAHTLDREEVFLAVSGVAVATLDGEQHTISAGDALIVPPGTTLRLAVPDRAPFEAVCAMAAGGQATLIGGDGAPFPPPWAV